MVLAQRESVGVAVQSVIGTFVAPTNLIPVTSFSAQEIAVQIPDNGRRGPNAMDFRAVQGVRRYDISMEGLIQPQAATGFFIGKLLRSIMGSGAVTPVQMGAEGTYNSDFQLGTAKEYLSIEHDTKLANKARRFSGCRVTELVIRWNAGEGALSFTCNLIGRDMALAASTDLSAQVVAMEDPFPGWRVNVAFNGALDHATPQFTRLINAEWRLTRSSSPLYTGQASQLYSDVYLGPLECVISMVMDYVDDTELALYRDAGATGTFLVPIVNKFKVGSNAGASTSLRRFYIAAEKASLLEAPAVLDSSGDNITLGISARALYSEEVSKITASGQADELNDAAFANGSSPVQVRLTDTKSSAY